MNILYAEDELAIAEIVTDLLTMEGHSVTHVKDGLTAYDMLNDKSKHFDLLLTDHMMPNLKGSELVMRVIMEGNQIPVIVTSGSLHIEKEYRHEEVITTHVNFIPKPFDVDKLLDKIKEIQHD